MTPQPVTNLSGYSLRANYGVKTGRNISKQSGGYVGDPFIWGYLDIVVDTISGGKLTEIRSLIANGASDSEVDEWNNQNPGFVYIWNNAGSYVPFSDLGATNENISDIIQAFEEKSGVDIPSNLKSEIGDTQDFVKGAMHIELVEKMPATLGLGLDGFGSSQGTDGSDFGWDDSLINVAGLSMQNLIADVK